MTRSDLLQLVEQAFHFLPRPPESEISFHQDECVHCKMSRNGLMKYSGTATELPEAAIWFVRDEWSTLSARFSLLTPGQAAVLLAILVQRRPAWTTRSRPG